MWTLNGEELQIDPSEALLSTQETNEAENQHDANETNNEEEVEVEFDQVAFAQFVVQIVELKCNLMQLSSMQFYKENGFHKEYQSEDYDEDHQTEMDHEPAPNNV